MYIFTFLRSVLDNTILCLGPYMSNSKLAQTLALLRANFLLDSHHISYLVGSLGLPPSHIVPHNMMGSTVRLLALNKVHISMQLR